MRRIVWLAVISLLGLGVAPVAHTGVAAAAAPPAGSVIALGATADFGNGTAFPDPNPELVPNIGQAVSVDGGAGTSAALLPDGTVWSWGSNHNGQLGDGTTTDSTTPVEAIGVSNAVAIASDGLHTLALTSGGAVWAWGANTVGQLGDGTTANQSTPELVSGLSDVVAISTDNSPDDTHGVGLALLADGTVWSWGSNQFEALGTGSPADHSAVPARVPGLSNVVSVSTSGFQGLAATSDGSVWAWGAGQFGELGDGQGGLDHIVPTPMQVPGLGSITSVSAGGSQSLARASDGTVWFWGATNPPPNTLDGQPSPVQVSGISDAVSVTAAPDAVFAVRSDGSLWDWGVNTVGQLGDGTLTSRFVPAQVEGIADVTSVSHSGALLVGTSVQCTGVCLSIGDVMSWAGGALAFPITLNEPAATDVTITVWENEDTRTYDDFKTVTIKPGHLETFLTVGAKNITSLPATNVVFAATLYSVTGASIGRLGGVGLVQPCCLAPSQVLVGAARIVEPDVGKVTVKVPLLLSVVDKVDKVTVQYRTSDGTATAGTDYVAKPPVTRPPATVGIRRGARRAAVAVVVLGDTNPEATETFSINFTNPMFATLPSATAPVSIIDNGD